MFEKTVSFIKDTFKTEKFIPLHVPVFMGNEKEYLNKCIDTTFVSSVGEFVDKFELMCAEYTGSKYAIAAVNGTSALHIALLLAGVGQDDEVITQPVTFVATCNAISYCNAKPLFVDIDKKTLGMNADILEEFLEINTYQKDDGCCYNRKTGQRIAACVPMHTFGHPVDIERIIEICNKYHIVVVEDSAESLGSYYKEKHTGIFGKLGVLSFNGNKTITTGGGGMILTNDEALAKKAKHITTTAKVPHKWDYVHDMIGYNYRLTNINAALGCAQMEELDKILANKRELAGLYKEFFAGEGIDFVSEREGCKSNYWLNAIIMKDRAERDAFLDFTNSKGVMTRPIWTLMNKLSMFNHAETTTLENASWLEDRLINIPSSYRPE